MLTFRPNPLQYFLVPDIEVEENGDEEEEDLEEEEEEVDENVNIIFFTFNLTIFGWSSSTGLALL